MVDFNKLLKQSKERRNLKMAKKIETEVTTTETTAAEPDFSAMSQEELDHYVKHGTLKAEGDGVPNHPDDSSDAGLNVDFNLEDEFKPVPLIPGGNYRANIVAVTHEASKYSIAFKLCFVENGVVMSDGTTAVDGSHDYYRMWLPKPGDKNELQSNGRVTKHQGKINSMKRDFDNLKIPVEDRKDRQAIAQSIIEQRWIGIPVIVAVDIEVYKGDARNRVQSITLDTTRA